MWKPVTRRQAALLLIALLLVTLAAAATQIRKPTAATDLDDATSNEAGATDFSGYDRSTWSTTVEPTGNASINWTNWDDTGAGPYTELSISITLNASGFTDDDWNIYYDNSSDTICRGDDHFIVGTAGVVLSDNPGITNATARLSRHQDLSLLEICLVGTVDGLGGDAGRAVSVFDIRTNGTLDTTFPAWQNQQHNDSTPIQGNAVKLAAQGRDNLNLSHATLATNETGTFQNKTVYSSPRTLYTENTPTWSNFTWRNTSLNAGTAVGWRIWYNDTTGNYNATDIQTFTLEDAFLAVELADPPTPFTAAQNTTFLLNATVTCRYGDCGRVNGTARYNTSQQPDTLIPELSGEPFHTVTKDNNITCASFLHRNEQCNVTWTLNATGTSGTIWLLDVNLSSNRTQWNDTDDATVEIFASIVDIRLRWSIIDFGALFPGTTDNPAANNSDRLYNVTVTDSSTTNVDLWINGSDLDQEDGRDMIGVGNVTWNATENDNKKTRMLTHALTPLKQDVVPGSNVTTYYWIDVPRGIYADNYTGTVMVKGNATT